MPGCNNRHRIALYVVGGVAFVAFCILLLLSFGASALTIQDDRDGFTEIDLPNGAGDWHRLSGVYVCRIWGTFDGATATMERIVLGDRATPTKIENISVAALVNVSVESNDERVEAGTTQYRLAVAGGLGAELISYQCLRVRSG